MIKLIASDLDGSLLDDNKNLPAGFEYMGKLTEKQANNTGLQNHNYYAKPDDSHLKEFYVYQQTGTPVGPNLIDSTQRQWSYVRWAVE